MGGRGEGDGGEDGEAAGGETDWSVLESLMIVLEKTGGLKKG